jgi:DNA-directed RNA polymerase specialized sigma24 family protein
MHDIEGLSAPKIAAALSAPLNTIYSRLRLARAKMTNLMRRGMLEP